VAKVDVDSAREVSERFGIRAMPTLLLFKQGRVIDQLVGAAPRAKLEAFLRRALPAGS
jgi:thioredoxin-like negative regulator of GroEL